jgi:hypothetical protein
MRITIVQVWLSNWTSNDDHSCSIVPDATGKVSMSAWHSAWLFFPRMTGKALGYLMRPQSDAAVKLCLLLAWGRLAWYATLHIQAETVVPGIAYNMPRRGLNPF